MVKNGSHGSYATLKSGASHKLRMMLRMMFASSAHRKISFRTWFFRTFLFLIKAWLSVKSLFLIKCNTPKNMENDQEPTCSSWLAIELHNFEVLLFLLYSYHTPELKDISIPALLSHSTISNFYQSANWSFGG